MHKVCTIITTYNSRKWLEQCLGSLQRSTVSVHTIVVDNGSEDGTPEKIRETFPEVELLMSETNLGFGAANNLGIKTALEKDAGYFFLLNHDAWVEPDTVETLLQISQKHPSCGILSPMHMNGEGSGLDYLFSTYIDPVKCPGLLSDLYMNQTKEIYFLRNVNAAAWFVRREVFETVGLFDDLFFMYGEDDNFLDRATYYGYKIGVTPKTKIYHDRQQRAFAKKDVKTDYHAQIKRMKVISLNPNLSLAEKGFLLFRKSMSDAIRNLQRKNPGFLLKNIKVFFLGLYYTVRYRNRYRSFQKRQG